MGFIMGYRDQHRVELEMQKIQKIDRAQLKKKQKKSKTRRQAADRKSTRLNSSHRT